MKSGKQHIRSTRKLQDKIHKHVIVFAFSSVYLVLLNELTTVCVVVEKVAVILVNFRKPMCF